MIYVSLLLVRLSCYSQALCLAFFLGGFRNRLCWFATGCTDGYSYSTLRVISFGGPYLKRWNAILPGHFQIIFCTDRSTSFLPVLPFASKEIQEDFPLAQFAAQTKRTAAGCHRPGKYPGESRWKLRRTTGIRKRSGRRENLPVWAQRRSPYWKQHLITEMDTRSSLLFTGLKPGQKYWFRVAAVGVRGAKVYSNEISSFVL